MTAEQQIEKLVSVNLLIENVDVLSCSQGSAMVSCLLFTTYCKETGKQPSMVMSEHGIHTRVQVRDDFAITALYNK